MDYDKIVLISLDTLRFDCLTKSGAKSWPDKYRVDNAAQSEFMDDILSDGCIFRNCISAAPYTSASHASYFTGQWPINHGLHQFFAGRLKSPTLFSYAKRTGYATCFKVDFPIIFGDFLGLNRDIEEYIVEDDERFLSWIAGSGKRIGLAHFGGAHIPYGFHNLKYGGDLYRQKVTLLEEEIGVVPVYSTDQILETFRSGEDLEMMLRYKRIVQHLYEQQGFDRLFSLYVEGVSHFYQTRLRSFLEKLFDTLSGTRYLLVLFSDHGEEYDQHSYGHFNTLSEGAIRVPVVFLGPDIMPGEHLGRIRSIDVAPTVIELAGLRCDGSALDGVSLAETLQFGEPYVERTAYAQAYTSEATEFVKYQKRLLDGGRGLSPLKHVRYKEIVYDGDFRLQRQNFRYFGDGGLSELRECPPELTLYSGTGNEITDSQEINRLNTMLDGYNAGLKRGLERKVPNDVRTGLRAMGYDV